MFSTMLFAVSIIALSQFAIYYWRAVLSGVAAQPVSSRVLEAARVNSGGFSAEDFTTLASLHDLTPQLNSDQGSMSFVRIYYRAVEWLGLAAERIAPSIAAWSNRERGLCARYAAVQIDRRLQANLALAASLRSC
jgi:hypothetical protein